MDNELTVVISRAWSAVDALQLSKDPTTRERAATIREALRRLDRPNSIHNLIAGGGEPPRMWLELFMFEYQRLVPFFATHPAGILRCEELGQTAVKLAIASAIVNATEAYDTAYGVFHACNSSDDGG